MDLTFLKDLPGFVKDFLGIITGAAAVFGIIGSYRMKTKTKRIKKQRNDLGIAALEEKAEQTSKEMRELHEETRNTIDKVKDAMKAFDDIQDEKMAQQFANISSAMEKITLAIQENEKDRLRDQIYTAADRARHGEHITGEYYSRIRETFTKYTDMGGNSGARQEYQFFCEYYNRQRQ